MLKKDDFICCVNYGVGVCTTLAQASCLCLLCCYLYTRARCSRQRGVVKSSTNETEPTEGNGCDEKNTYEFTETIYTETLFYLNGSGECELAGNPYIRQYNFDKTNMKFWYVDLENYPNYIKKINRYRIGL